MIFGVRWKSGTKMFTSMDKTEFRGMLDAYLYETNRILDFFGLSPQETKQFISGASMATLALGAGRGSIHDAYRAALFAASYMGHDIIPYEDTAVASMNAKEIGE